MSKSLLRGSAYLAILFVLGICAAVVASLPSDDGTTSVEEVSKNFGDYENRTVKVRGFCNIAFEGFFGLYSRDFRKETKLDEPLYAIWIEVPEKFGIPWKIDGCEDQHGELMVVEGSLEPRSKYLGEAKGNVTVPALVDITKIERWKPPQ